MENSENRLLANQLDDAIFNLSYYQSNEYFEELKRVIDDITLKNNCELELSSEQRDVLIKISKEMDETKSRIDFFFNTYNVLHYTSSKY